ncbi:MAG: helix-turn-helix domain-containing protein [Oceanicaulis sp.]
MSVLFILEIIGAGLALAAAAAVLSARLRDRRALAVAGLLATTAAFLLRGAFEPGGAGGAVLALAAAAPCGAAWIAARALFRPDPAYTLAHIGVVGVILAALLAAQVLPAALSQSVLTVSNLVSSTVILLALWEAGRGWRDDWPAREKNLRYGFFAVYGAAVTGGVVVLGGIGPASHALTEAVQSAALAGVAAYVAATFALRPAPPAARAKAPAPPPDAALHALAERIEAEVKAREAYLTASLKVDDLARRLGEPPYKISRAVTRVLGAANFNQYLNTFRVEHARRQLVETPEESILGVALDSGFASLGPFNRAFKAATGETPRDYRARRAGPPGLPAA